MQRKKIPCQAVDSKQKLGISVGLPVATSSIAIIDAGDTDSEIKSMRA